MKLKVAFIGCGKIASRHAKIISELDTAQLVAVSDVIPEKAQAFAREFGVPFYTDFREMLKRHSVDVVSILTPSGTHGKIALEVVEDFEKHLIVEKPLALLISEAKRVIDAAKRRGVFLITVFQNRFNLPVMKLKEALDKGRFGKLVLASARLYWCRRQDYYDANPYRGTWAMDGGVIANQACHCVDMLQWLAGPVESVYAKMETRLMKMEADDTAVVVFRYKNGALGSIEATVCSRPKDLGCSLIVMGEKGSVELSGAAMNKLSKWMFEEPTPEDEKVVKEYAENPPDPVGYAHREYLKHAFLYISSQGKIRHPALVIEEEGLKSVEIIQAAYESSERKEEVKLPFVPERSKLGVG